MLQSNIKSIQWNKQSLVLLDQRKLPGQESYIELTMVKEVAEAIESMVVRGAPAIGITAAYGVVLSVISSQQNKGRHWKQQVMEDIRLLAASRPTAVNLSWALDRMQACLNDLDQSLPDQLAIDLLQAEAVRIHQEDLENNLQMSKYGAERIAAGSKIVTHCNTGSLATGGYGTALGVIRTAYSQGRAGQVYVGETRPWLQGARLTAWELVQDNIPVTVVCDSAVASLLLDQAVDWIIVGADRIAANGDVANKIGTYALAVLAHYHSVKMMVVAPTSSIDTTIATGADIPIEYRSRQELLSGQHSLETGIWNPVFDITTADLIDVIVTEKGLIDRPNAEKVAAMMS